MINTGTTIVTFLMVFLIQNTQNRDSAAVQLKLDELHPGAAGAHNALLDLEELAEGDLERLRGRYEALAPPRADLLRGLGTRTRPTWPSPPRRRSPPTAERTASRWHGPPAGPGALGGPARPGLGPSGAAQCKIRCRAHQIARTGERMSWGTGSFSGPA